MKSQIKSNSTLSSISEQQVADYLLENPDFLEQNTEVLAAIDVPHATGSAVSLIQRQVNLLREKNTQFEGRLRDMIEAVHDNQRLNDSLHRLTINLFLCEGLDDCIATISEELNQNLDTDYVTIKLLSDNPGELGRSPERFMSVDEPGMNEFRRLLEEKRIQCGRLTGSQIQLLFGDVENEVNSAAFIPLADVDSFGFIGLGSQSAQRYHPGMGTEFLKKLGELCSAALRANR